MKEIDLINTILQQFERSPDQLNKPHCSDSEIVELNGQLLAITMDEFSEEDCFGDMTPQNLGWNMTVATVSDLLAVGALPTFFIHSISSKTNNSYIKEFSKGISNVLKKLGAFLIGGDVGQSEFLRYSATAIGTLSNNKYLSRELPNIEQDLWITGTLGDANLAALLIKPAPIFELRLDEAEFIRNSATACIDTSGGFIDAVWILNDINPGLKFNLNSLTFPIDEKIKEYCEGSGMPINAFLYGGAGEYELMFAVPRGENVNIKATKIGTISVGSGLFVDDVEILEAPPCPRSFPDRKSYTHEILKRSWL